MPKLPTVKQVMEAISHSNNSCAGPDGVSFAAWRAVAKHAAPVLHLVLQAMAAGRLPPEGYNHGLLFLISKKGTLLPSDTRPISVTNCDNRILAKAVVAAITPALLATLHKAQKGFVQGRHFEEHLRELNERFYEIVEQGKAGENYFVLFMDTAKAFDSIDHDFIHVAVRRAGLPAWFQQLVRALLHQVRVKPAIRGAQAHWIDICRGVKQGCPLSPLLFVICYDVLLERIDQVEGAEPRACADDLAVGSGDFLCLWQPMRLVDDFRGASGLGINEDKTRIVSARPSRLHDYIGVCSGRVSALVYANRCPWRLVKEAIDYTYLGILFGRYVGVEDVYAKALTGLEDRAARFRPCMRHLSHASRVLVYNTFIITKMSYLVKFFHIPFKREARACVEGRIKARAMGLLLTIRHSYSYPYLVVPDSMTSPSPPIKDAWILSMSTLIAQADLWQWHGQGAVDHSVITYPEDSNSMCMSRHVRSAATDFVCRVTAETEAAFDAAAFDKDTGSARRASITEMLLRTDYCGAVDEDLALVLARRGLSRCEELVPVLHTNFGLFPARFPSHYRNVQFELLVNSLCTDKRVKASRTQTDPISPCHICGKGEDSIRHIFGGECEPVVLARKAVSKHIAYYDGKESFPDLDTDTLEAADFWSASLLAFPRPGRDLPAKTRKAAVQAMALFNGVVWLERAYYFRLHAEGLGIFQAASHLAAITALEHLRTHRSKATTGFGSAGKRTAAQKEAARAHGRRVIDSVPSRTLIAFTDGSASPNPGPSGAGAYVYSSTEGDAWNDEAIAALGHGTNNQGELWAIGMAAQIILRRVQAAPGDYDGGRVFTDSTFAKCCLEGVWKTSKYPELVAAVAAIIDEIKTFIDFKIIWVPAHVGIDANEHADFLAGEARNTVLSVETYLM